MQKNALVLMGHGSKSKDAIDEFNYVVEVTKAKSTNMVVYGAHMDIAKPTLEEVILEISGIGVQKVVVMPYFLFNGNHIKFDIPKQIEALQLLYPKMEIIFGTPIGREPLMADLMLKKTVDLTGS